VRAGPQRLATATAANSATCGAGCAVMRHSIQAWAAFAAAISGGRSGSPSSLAGRGFGSATESAAHVRSTRR